MIDFVVLWVDGSDEEWRLSRNKKLAEITGKEVDNRDERYRDYGIFKYWFRCVEKNAPWVRKIHLVTNGQVPEWLNTKHDKLQLDFHDSFMDPRSLPTYNTNAIEMQLLNLKDLAEQFVYFNDDMFLIRPVTPDFFFRNGIRCDYFCEDFIAPDGMFPQMRINNMQLINSVIGDKRKTIRKIGYSKWFSPKLFGTHLLYNLFFYFSSDKFAGFSLEHTAQPYTKTLLKETFDLFGDKIEPTFFNNFRTYDDVTQYLFRYYSFITGQYVINPKTRGMIRHVSDTKKINKLLNVHAKYPILCINDETIDSSQFDSIQKELIDSFEKAFPDKSSFEK